MISPFERMPIDLIDFSNKSANGYKYMCVAIDNFSRYLFTRPLRNKTPNLTAKAMKESIQEIKEKLDTKIGHILADRGTELMGEFRGLLKTKQNPK